MLKLYYSLNPLIIFLVKVRNSFTTGVLLYGRKVHAAHKMVETTKRVFNLPTFARI